VYITVPNDRTAKINHKVIAKNESDSKHTLFKVTVDKPKWYTVRPRLGVVGPGEQTEIMLRVQRDFPDDLSELENRFRILTVQREKAPTEDLADLWNQIPKEQCEKVMFAVRFKAEGALPISTVAEMTAPTPPVTGATPGSATQYITEERKTTQKIDDEENDENPIQSIADENARRNTAVVPGDEGLLEDLPKPVGAVAEENNDSALKKTVEKTRPSEGVITEDEYRERSESQTAPPVPLESVEELRAQVEAREKEAAALQEELKNLGIKNKTPSVADQLKLLRTSVDEELGSGNPLLHLAMMMVINILVVKLLI